MTDPVRFLFHRWRLRSAVAACCLLLAACIPAPLGKYYKPIYRDGGIARVEYSGNQCHGATGAPVSMKVALAEGVTLKARADTDRLDAASAPTDAGGMRLNLALEVPAGVSVRFEGREARVGADDRAAVVVPMPAFEVSATRMFPGDATIDPQRISPTPQLFADGLPTPARFETQLSIAYALPDFVPPAIEVEMPGLRFADEPAPADTPSGAAPLILRARAAARPESFAGQYKDTRSLVYRTVEAQATLEARQRQCLERQPQQTAQCSRLAAYDDGRFDVLQGAVRYSGRWYVHDTRRKEPFRGEVSLQHRRAAGWQLSRNAIRVRDLSGVGSDAVKIHRIDRMWVRFRYEAPFDAAFVGVDDHPGLAALGGTELRLSLPLETMPSQASRHAVHLPALRINGTLVPLQPIEIEKRLFDVGLSPFNC